MAFVPTPNCVQLEMVMLWNSQVVQNVFHYVKSAPWDVDSMEELGDGFVGAIAAGFDTLVSDTLSVTSLRITDLSAQNAPSIEYGTGLPIAGEAVSPSLPNSVTCVVSKRTQLRGRSFRGRIYHCGLVESQVTGNVLGTGVAAALVAFYSSLNPINLPTITDEAIMVVLSRFSEGSPRATGLATPVNSFTCDGIIDSQRRRLPGRGA